MNKYVCIGRLTEDPREFEYDEGSKLRAHFALAIKRPVKNGGVDYPEFVAYGRKAGIVVEHLQKGMQVGIEASLNTYKRDEGDGTNKTQQIFVVDRLTFVGGKQNEVEQELADGGQEDEPQS